MLRAQVDHPLRPHPGQMFGAGPGHDSTRASAPQPPAACGVFAFGPFRLDTAAGALFRGATFVAVTPKALDILIVLVEAGGRLVTKEEILERVWPDAFVEEGSIANNISALRKVLNPYFGSDGPIATVSRRGYRFTEQVHKVETASGNSRSAEAAGSVAAAAKADQSAIAGYSAKADHRATVDLTVPTTARFAAVVAQIQQRTDQTAVSELDHLLSSTRVAAIAAAAIVVVGAIAVGTAMQVTTGEQAGIAGPRRSVAVLPMKNLTGDPSHAWLSGALAETIMAELAGTDFRVVSAENVSRMQQALRPPAGVGLTRKQLDEIGRDLGSDLILTGNYLVVSGKVRVDVRLDEVATGQAVASASVTDSVDRFLDVVSQAGAALRSAIGADPQTSDRADAIRASLSINPDALKNYFLGLDALRLRDGPKARDYLLAAVGADGHFALAHSALSITWRLLGYDTRGAESAKRAFDQSSRLSAEDRIMVEAQYYEAVAQYPKAIDAWQKLWKLYPDNLEYGLKLGNAQWLGGRSKDTVATVEELRRMPERDSRDGRIDLLEATAVDVLGDSRRAAEIVARAAEKAVASKATLMLARARIKQGIYANRQSKYDEALAYYVEAERLFAELGEVGGVADAIRWQATLASDRANYADAMRLLDRAYTMAASTNYVRLMAVIQNTQSTAARNLGDLPRALGLAESAHALARESGDRVTQGNALMSLGMSARLQGDYARARDAYAQAGRIAAETGDSKGENNALNSVAVVDFLAGDLAAARASWERILVVDRKNGAPASIGLRMQNLSRVLALQDDLTGAERLNVEECRIYETTKHQVNLAWCRTRLAGLWLDMGRATEAEALVKQISIADFGTGALAPPYIARLARAQLTLGRIDAAAATIAAAEQVQAKAGAVEEQAIHVSTIRAEVEAAQGKRAAAIKRLRRAIAEADRLGLKTWSLDARLVLSRLDRRETATTERLAREAAFAFISRKAQELSVISS